jgi:hypothetical protein
MENSLIYHSLFETVIGTSGMGQHHYYWCPQIMELILINHIIVPAGIERILVIVEKDGNTIIHTSRILVAGTTG